MKTFKSPTLPWLLIVALLSMGAATTVIYDNITVTSINNVQYIDPNDTTDWGTKVNNAFAAIPNGGTVYSLGESTAENFTTPVLFPGEGHNLVLGSASYLFCGAVSADAFLSHTTAAGTPIRHNSIRGQGNWATVIGMQTGCANIASSVVRFGWTTHNNLEDLTIYPNDKATYGLHEDQALDTVVRNVVITHLDGTPPAGAIAHLCSGCGYGTYIQHTAARGNYSLWMQSNVTVVTAGIAAALLYDTTSNDGQEAKYNNFFELQTYLAVNSNIILACNGANLPIHGNTFYSIRSAFAGTGVADDNDENGLVLSCPTPSGTETINNNHIDGYFTANNMHDVVLHGDVHDNTLNIKTLGSGANADSAYSLWIRDGAATVLNYNNITANLSNSTAGASNRAFRLDDSAALNTFNVSVGALASIFNGDTLTTNNILYTTNTGTAWYVAGSSQFTNLNFNATLFSALGTPANGRQVYCSDCAIANPCTGSSTGAIAKRLNSVWVCN